MLMAVNGSADRSRTVRRLKCAVKKYVWGKMGSESQAARLFSLNSDAGIEEDEPYAEFWMGTHGSGPSYICNDDGVSIGEEGLSLKTWIEENPQVLGDKVVEKWGANLPFLFKVLSVAKALSIQAHPDKQMAELLHKMRPDVFKDANHKPEMALALTKFEALCGFVGLEELKDIFRSVPEIVIVVGDAYTNKILEIDEEGGEEKIKEVLRLTFTELMSASKDVVSKAVSKLKDRLNIASEVRQLTDKEQLVLRLGKQYPGDIGVLASFFFNYVRLDPGEALYLGANELHAYLSGECIECMATSDNVVRAGLTPKSLDVQILCSMLTYKQGFPEILQGTPLNLYTKRYSPPFDEFEVDQCILPRGETIVFEAVPGPSIFMVIEGKGTLCATSLDDDVKEGNVLFVNANIGISFTASSSGLHMYRAGVNSNFFEAS